MNLFSGYTEAYGLYRLGKHTSIKASGKVTGKPSTVRKKLTPQEWVYHLEGSQGLGVIPITDKSEVMFGAIDIDEYSLDIPKLCQEIIEKQLPLVPCKTKSGGIHLYVFFRDWTPAGPVIEQLRSIAASLGFGGSEIFPRQANIIADRGDIGQWINMPYFEGNKTDRPGLSADGEPLSLEDFLMTAEAMRVDPAEFVAVEHEAKKSDLDGAPPCLTHLCHQGFPEGTRNNGLLNLAVFAKKAYPDAWQAVLDKMNQKYMDPPLTATEVVGIMNSVRKKDYQYTCKTAPIQQHCNSHKCRLCKHGVGGGSGLPVMGTLTKLCTNPAIWFIDVEVGDKTHRIELSTEDLQMPVRFQRRCMEVINVMPQIPKRDEWQNIIAELLQAVNEVEVSEDATPQGQLRNHLEDFLTNKACGQEMQDMLTGRPTLVDNVYHFRLRDFIAYLDRLRFQEFKMNKVAMYLREWGCVKKFSNLKGKGVNHFSVNNIFAVVESLDLPKQADPEF
jgi:hypothetical protein